MQRITISLDDELADSLDAYLRSLGYQSRSEGVRDLVREAMGRQDDDGLAHTHCVANLSYVYNHRVRALASKLSDFQHAHHDLIAAVTTMPLDHENSLESVMLKGKMQAVRAFSDRVKCERGVRSSVLNFVRTKPNDEHEGPHDHHHEGHEHLSPIN